MKVSAVLITREKEYPRDIILDFPFDEVVIETSCPNVRRRFELAEVARGDVIYVQDDDVQVDINDLWAEYDGRLTNVISPYHKRVYEGTGVTLIGWGAFFPKRLIDFSRWEAAYGEVHPMEADRIFTYLAQPHNTIVRQINEHVRSVRMCNEREHYRDKDRIIAQLKRLP